MANCKKCQFSPTSISIVKSSWQTPSFTINFLCSKNFKMTSVRMAHKAWMMASQLFKGSDLRGLDDHLIKVGINFKVRSISIYIYHDYFPCVFVISTLWVCFSIEIREFQHHFRNRRKYFHAQPHLYARSNFFFFSISKTNLIFV